VTTLLLNSCETNCVCRDANWGLVSSEGLEPIRVLYGDFVVSRAATIRRVLETLGIDPPAPGGKEPMKRQADDLSSDWVVRFRADSEHRPRI